MKLKPKHWYRSWQSLLMVAFLSLLLSFPTLGGLAQTRPTEGGSPQPQDTLRPESNLIDGYPVSLDGKTLLTVRQGVGLFSAQERAEAIVQRLERIAADRQIAIDSIQLVKQEDDQTLYLKTGDIVILSINEQDANVYGLALEELGQRALNTIKTSLIKYRQERSLRYLLTSVGATFLATMLFLLLVQISIRSSGKIFPAIAKAVEHLIPSIRIQAFEVISSRQISSFCLRLLQFTRLFIWLFIFYIYISFVLGLFPWTQTISESILGYFFLALDLLFKSIAQYLPNLVILGIVIAFTHYLLKIIKPFFSAIERGNLVIPGFYRDWAEPTFRLVWILVIALAAVVAFPYLPGFDSPAFRGISVFLGILFSLGSTTAVANVVGGVILIYTRAFQIGDRIQIGDVTGDVLEKTLLVTRIITPTNRIVTIPNSSLLSSNVINFSVASRELQRYLILQTTVTLGYDLPWRTVHETLTQAALATADILPDPAPFVLQTSLDDFYVSYQLNTYTDHPERMVKIYSALHQNIQDYCNEVGIEIMSPSFYALRDGHHSTIPENYLAADYRAPGFRTMSLGNENS
jgi:small-conductance mechanosensitive channel